jgi:hypothetical protein
LKPVKDSAQKPLYNRIGNGRSQKPVEVQFAEKVDRQKKPTGFGKYSSQDYPESSVLFSPA